MRPASWKAQASESSAGRARYQAFFTGASPDVAPVSLEPPAKLQIARAIPSTIAVAAAMSATGERRRRKSGTSNAPEGRGSAAARGWGNDCGGSGFDSGEDVGTGVVVAS